MKKLKISCLFILLAFLLVLPAAGAEPDIQVLLDGTPLSFDAAPFVMENRTLVPFRGIFEGLGYHVSWDGGVGVSAVSADHRIELTLGGTEMMVDGTVYTLDVAPMAADGRTYVPVRAISEASDCDVFWDGKNQAVLIYRRREAGTLGGAGGHGLFCACGGDIYTGYWTYDNNLKSLRISPEGKAELFPDLPGSGEYLCQEGKIYGYFKAGNASQASLDVYDPESGDITCLVDQDVFSFGLWEDHIYFNAIEGEPGFYRADLDGSGLVKLSEHPIDSDMILSNGLAFSYEGEVRSLETGETVFRFLTEEERFQEVPSSIAVANGAFYMAVNRFRFQTWQPIGIRVWNWESGETDLISLPWIVRSLDVTGNSIFVETEDTEGWSFYRLTLDGTHPVLLAQVPAEGEYPVCGALAAVGNYLYYTRAYYIGMEKHTFLARLPMAGGPEEILWEGIDLVTSFG